MAVHNKTPNSRMILDLLQTQKHSTEAKEENKTKKRKFGKNENKRS